MIKVFAGLIDSVGVLLFWLGIWHIWEESIPKEKRLKAAIISMIIGIFIVVLMNMIYPKVQACLAWGMF